MSLIWTGFRIYRLKKKNPQFLVNKVSLSSKFDFRTLIESDSLIRN